jgi:hypothetical protein
VATSLAETPVEVDFMLEAPDVSLAGVVVNLSVTVTIMDLRKLRSLREDAGSAFATALVYTPGKP